MAGTKTTTGEHPGTDTMPTVSVVEAARILNVTPDAIRARLRRGTLLGGKRGAEWFVQLPADADLTGEYDSQQDTDTTRHDVTGPRQDALVDQLRSEVEYLRERLTATQQQLASERERADVLHREALGRIEALTATVSDQQDVRQDATERPESANETTQRPDLVEDALGRRAAGLLTTLRRWLRGSD